MSDESLEALLAAKLAWAWNSGCPVAGWSDEFRAEMASIVRRRWFSFERRKPKKVSDEQSRQIEDLARCLCEKYERGGLRMAGAVIEDYRWLAAQLAEVLSNSVQKAE
jgi:hypothetical protein